ncbi:hypothetical protein [Nocardia aurea]|uniref:hypothetical protein n=1 Tax=Nocardia aurea TaxID=2144174 RepID=UPI0018E56085
MPADSRYPVARSDDGRSFVIADAIGSSFVAGSLVVVHADGTRQLALVEERTLTTPVRLRGRLIGELAVDGIDTGVSHAFDSGRVEPVDSGIVQTLHETTGAVLDIGVNLTPPFGPARLLPKRYCSSSTRRTIWPRRTWIPRSRSRCGSDSSRSPRKDANSVCGCCFRPSVRPRSIPASCPSATIWR